MTDQKDHKVAWSSDEVVEKAGLYLAECCGIPFELNLIPEDKFPRCPSCRKKIKWQRKYRVK
jgi:hypothetical protein